jgi:hypothetical protein
MHGRSPLGSAHFSDLSLRYAFYLLLLSDGRKMRLVFSENDLIYKIPDEHILRREFQLKVHLGFPL